MEIKRYIGILQRWAWLIVLSIVIAGGAAYLISNNSARVYQASTRLLVDHAPGSGNDYTQLLLEQRLTATYVELITLKPVFEETIARLNLPVSAERLAARVEVSTPRDTQLIVIRAEDTSPEIAAAIANTVGEVFIDQHEARQRSRFDHSINTWEEQVQELRQEMSDLQAQILVLQGTEDAVQKVELQELQADLRETESRYREAFNNLEGLRVEEARSSNNILIIEEARRPQSPVRPRPVLNGILGAMVGGMLVLGLIFLLEYMDDTIKSPDQLEEALGLSPIGAIASIKANTPPERLITYHTPRAPISEAYRVLRTNLSFSAIDEGLHALLVSSASPGEGKSTTAANLAVVMAQTGQQVIIVDSDLRRPTQHSIFDLPNNQGLTTALLDSKTPVTAHLQQTQISNLRMMSSGPIPPNPAELLNSQRMRQVMEELKEASDVIIFDTPPLLTVTDAALLAPHMNGSVVVAEVGSTRLQGLEQALETLHKSNAHLLGVVLNQVSLGRAGYYYHYRYYNYDYSKKPDKKWWDRMPEWLSALGRRS